MPSPQRVRPGKGNAEPAASFPRHQPCRGGLRVSHQAIDMGRATRQVFPRRAKRVLVAEPIGEANRCELGHLTPKMLQKALQVGCFG
jgi:hypothetical protein